MTETETTYGLLRRDNTSYSNEGSAHAIYKLPITILRKPETHSAKYIKLEGIVLSSMEIRPSKTNTSAASHRMIDPENPYAGFKIFESREARKRLSKKEEEKKLLVEMLARLKGLFYLNL
ncbi:MAG: hypothetical protein ACP5SA_01350 [Candidatus Micrarchaeia archaeon]